jgi:hypothetical protein
MDDTTVLKTADLLVLQIAFCNFIFPERPIFLFTVKQNPFLFYLNLSVHEGFH